MPKKGKKAKVKVGIKEPEIRQEQEKKLPPGKPPKRIRMLVSCANQHGAFTNGSSYKVPEEVPVNTARGWIDCGYAEEDKSLAGVPEEIK